MGRAVYKINRENPWPPELDLATIRSTLRALEGDMRRIPQFIEVAEALTQTLAALDKVEAKHPIRLSDHVYTTSRFRTNPCDL